MDDWKKDRLASALDDTNPTLIIKMKSGVAVLGDSQLLPGYSILMAYPIVKCLNDLGIQGRSDFLLDMSLLGDAILNVCKPAKINYEILINAADFLHAHVFPRYEWEPEERRKMPIWLYPKEYRFSHENMFSEEKHSKMRNQIAENLKDLINKNY
jgi:diadenosine tetraphosphate (Ap4A) HIT family hydrolase